MITYPLNRRSYLVPSALLMMLSIFALPAAADGLASDYDAIPPVISLAGQNDKPNIMVILDNSNSMDEATDGHAVGSDDPDSKSEIARNAIKSIIDTFGDNMRMGLMAYEQTGVTTRQLHDSQYDVSFSPSNYDPTYTGIRDSIKKAKRVANPTDGSNFIHYNVALPFYSGSSLGNAFCYSSTADFDNGSETTSGPWDSYQCYQTKTGSSDSGTSGMSNYWFQSTFSPTDSDIAQNILDFGKYLTWQHVGPTWFSNSSPGGGQVYVNIDDIDASQKTTLFNKLATSQFVTNSSTGSYPIQNAGLTPIEGTLIDAGNYFSSYTSGNACSVSENDYVILVTDGLPSVDKDGNQTTDTAAAIAAAAAEAANLFADGIKTYVIGFALPTGVDTDLFDTIAISGGTEQSYEADDEASLNSALTSIFQNIINRSSSGTGAAVLANNSRGDGAFYQALYVPKQQDALGNEVTWVGVLNGLFIDQYGYLREDTNGNKQIDDYSTDKVVEYYYDETQARTRIRLKTGSDQDNLTAETEPVEIDDLNYIWSARDQLGAISDPITQRSYSTSAANGRTIYTSTNGSDLTNFVSLTPAEQQALVDAQTAAETARDTAEATVNASELTKDNAYTAMTSAETTHNKNLETLAEYKEVLRVAEDAKDAADILLAEARANHADPGHPGYLDDDLLDEFVEDTYSPIEDAYEDALEDYNDFVPTANASESALTSATTAYNTAESTWSADVIAYNNAVTAYNEAVQQALNAQYFSYMSLSALEANKTVRWVRGEDVSGYRSRAFDWDNDGITEVWRLGDIIHSTPVVVATPRDRYDLTHSDSTYAAFVDKYYNRRHVIYVGGNDGMLHAFNAGFWDDTNKAFKTRPSDTSTVTEHPLGSELWGYIPKAALPHLQWLTSTNYSHTYYVDGEPLTFDANIFDNDTDHPNGWGTILVVPMRLGGGEFSVDTDGDSNVDEVLRSSISIFDVTNPEVAPILLAEISHEDLGFTTSKPALVKARLQAETGGYASPSADRWLLAFGSGPNVLDSATSTQNAQLFLYDLESKSFVSNYAPLDLGDTNSYVGSIGVADWESDYVDDALYFGVNSGLDATETGRLARIRLGSSDTSTFDESTWLSHGVSNAGTLLTPQRTTLGAPLAVRDDNGKRWVYGGTGRLFVSGDNSSDKQQYYYGVMEPVDANGLETLGTVATNTLEDVTDIQVYTNGETDKNSSSYQIPSGTDIENFNQLEYAISNSKQGWYHRLTYSAGTPSGRNITGSARFRSLLFYTEYSPSSDSCVPEGTSKLHAVHYKTGTATPYDVIGTDSSVTKNDGELVLSGLDLGNGLASAPTIITNSAGSKENSAGTLAIQLGTGELKLINFGEGGTIGGRESWQEIDMDGLNL